MTRKRPALQTKSVTACNDASGQDGIEPLAKRSKSAQSSASSLTSRSNIEILFGSNVPTPSPLLAYPLGEELNEVDMKDDAEERLDDDDEVVLDEEEEQEAAAVRGISMRPMNGQPTAVAAQTMSHNAPMLPFLDGPKTTLERLARHRPIPIGQTKPRHFSPSYPVTAALTVKIDKSNPLIEAYLTSLNLPIGEHPDPLATNFTALAISDPDAIQTNGVVYVRSCAPLKKDMQQLMEDFQAEKVTSSGKTGITAKGKAGFIRRFKHILIRTAQWKADARVNLNYIGMTTRSARFRWDVEDMPSAQQQVLNFFLLVVRKHLLIKVSSRDVVIAIVGPRDALQSEAVLANSFGIDSIDSINVAGCGRSMSQQGNNLIRRYRYDVSDRSSTLIAKRCFGVAFNTKNHPVAAVSGCATNIERPNSGLLTNLTPMTPCTLGQPTSSPDFLPCDNFGLRVDNSDGYADSCFKCTTEYSYYQKIMRAAVSSGNGQGGLTKEVADACARTMESYIYKPKPSVTGVGRAANHSINEHGVVQKRCTGVCRRMLDDSLANFGVVKAGGFRPQCYECRGNVIPNRKKQYTPRLSTTKASRAAADTVDETGVKWRTCAGKCSEKKELNKVMFASYTKYPNTFHRVCRHCYAVDQRERRAESREITT